MKKYIIVLLIVFCVSGLYAEELKFRGMSFGITPEEVIAHEGEPDDIDTIIYLSKNCERYIYKSMFVAGFYSEGRILFRDNKMMAGKYDIKPMTDGVGGERALSVAYYKAFHNLYRKLCDIYGNKDEYNFSEEYEEEPSSDTLGYFSANAPYDVKWRLDDALIILSMEETDWFWSLTLTYQSPELTHIEETIDDNTEGL